MSRDLSASHGLWAATAPPQPPTGPLRGRMRAGVAVIGGGYTGLSAALRLAETGVEVALLEAVAIGFGAAGRNVGLVNAGMWVRPDVVPATLGSETGERLLASLGAGPDLVFELIARHGIACEPVRAGTLHCAVGPRGRQEIEQRAAQWTARGAPVRLLGPDETRAKLGGGDHAGSLLDLRAGTVQPLAYARGLAEAAMRAGAGLFTGSPVTGAERRDGCWHLATPEGAVEAEQVIVATDAYGTGPWPEIAAEQVRLPYFNAATAPLGALAASILPERQGAWDTRAVLSSVRMDQAGRLIVGSVGALRGTGRAVHRAWARRLLVRLFPQLGEITFTHEWDGQIGMTADHLPRLHRLGPGVVSVSGYNGRGIAPGTVLGRAVAELVAGRIGDRDLPLPVTAPRPARHRRLREAGIEWGAQLAHLAAARRRGRPSSTR